MQSLQAVYEKWSDFYNTCVHPDGNGDPVPSRSHRRMNYWRFVPLAPRRHEGTTLEWASDGCLNGFTDDEVNDDNMLAGRRPLNVLTLILTRPSDYKNQLKALETCTISAEEVAALTIPDRWNEYEFLTLWIKYDAYQVPVIKLPVEEYGVRDRRSKIAEETLRCRCVQPFNWLGSHIIGDTYWKQ